ncbi:RNA methyltransferase [Thermodesulfobacteriota bacterium]
MFKPNLYLALIHYPVISKNGEIIASAVTNLDLHDIARTARTYDVKGFYVVTPLEDQRTLVSRILAHWTEGEGARYNPQRGEALALVDIEANFSDVCRAVQAREKRRPQVVATSARVASGTVSFQGLRDMLATGDPYILAFGTAWGLAEDFIEATDYVLDPIEGDRDYNHLAVRSAAAIVLDRLVGS